MFNRELQQCTTAITDASVSRNGDLEDVVAALRTVPVVEYANVDSTYLGEGVKRVQLVVHTLHGCLTLSFRISSDYFLVLRSTFSHDGRTHYVRWMHDYSKFTYPIADYRDVVYGFMSAVIAGF